MRPTVPEMGGLSIDHARLVASDAGFDLVVSATLYSIEPADTVIGQTPETGARPLLRRTLRVVLSSGKQTITIPDLVGETELRARSVLEQLGLNAQVVYEYSPDAIGKVVSTTPIAHSAIETGDIVVVRIGAPRSQVSLIEYDLHSNTVAIVVDDRESDITIARDIALRLSSLLQAAQATVIVQGTGDPVSEDISLVISLSSDDHTVETIAIAGASPPDGEADSAMLAQQIAAALEAIPVSTSYGVVEWKFAFDPDRAAEVSFGLEGDTALYKDTRWKDNVARSLYLAIGKTLVR
jgi:hypothetical protein